MFHVKPWASLAVDLTKPHVPLVSNARFNGCIAGWALDVPNTIILDPAADRDTVLAAFNVSRETSARLDRFVALLKQWQRTTNLVAPSTLSTLWVRHIADSLQLLSLVSRSGKSRPAPSDASPPGASDVTVPWTWVDLGSGGGFPGVVIACALADTAGDQGSEAARAAHVHLIESRQRKAEFLREAVRVTGAPATVHCARIEEIGPQLRDKADVITARGLAPLPQLCDLVAPLLRKGATALLMKGQDLETELTAATKSWNIEYDLVPSRTSAAGRIMIVHALSRRRGAPFLDRRGLDAARG